MHMDGPMDAPIAAGRRRLTHAQTKLRSHTHMHTQSYAGMHACTHKAVLAPTPAPRNGQLAGWTTRRTVHSEVVGPICSLVIRDFFFFKRSVYPLKDCANLFQSATFFRRGLL